MVHVSPSTPYRRHFAEFLARKHRLAGNPGVIFVACCELLPNPDKAVLEILVSPEVASVGTAVRMPSPTLTAWSCVDVDDGVNGVFGT